MAVAGTAWVDVDGSVAEGEAGFGCISKAAAEVTPTAWPITARFPFLLRHTSRPPTERPMARTRNIGTPMLTPMIHEPSDGPPTDSPWGLEVELGGGGLEVELGGGGAEVPGTVDEHPGPGEVEQNEPQS